MAAFKKRMMERYALAMPVLLAFDTENGGPVSLELQTRDISSSGAYLETTRSLPVGTAVKLDLTLPLEKFQFLDVQQARIAVTGSVIRTDPKGMAVCFDDKYRISPVPESFDS